MESNTKQISSELILIILRGIPGSGKSTLAEHLSESGLYPICCADDYLIDGDGNYNWSGDKLHSAHIYSENRCEYFMKQKTKRIIVSNTAVKERDMKAYFKLAETYGYMTFSTIVENRHGGVSEHDVPDGTLEGMKEKFNIKL